jgi:glycosyltransferase involved in cell wall biosynthesis
METNGFATFGNDLLTGSQSQNINIEELIAAPHSENSMILPFNLPDAIKTVSIGDIHAGKIKILAIPSDRTGVGKYRTIDPHRMLHHLYKDEFYVEINPEPDYNNADYFRQFNIIHISKTPNIDPGKGEEIVKRLKGLGCILVVDTDDYWSVDSFSPHFYGMKKFKTNEKLLNIINLADWVTTTTPIFAKEIRKFNKNVAVLVNSIDSEEPQFQPKPNPSGLLRVGFLGGSSHLDDIMLLNSLCNRLIPYQDKVQLVLIGFDTRGAMIERVEKDGKLTRRPMKPEETVWYEYEQVFTSKHALLSKYPDYVKYLKLYTQEPYLPETPEVEANMPYRRLWTKDIHNYAKNYNNLDVSLAPLVENKFNSFKSQLKVVEAGFHKKALIAQNFGPYTLDLTPIIANGVINPKGNAYLIDSRLNHKEWFKAVKFLLDHPDVREMMINNLYEMVSEKFDLKKTTVARAEFYRSLF